jgi:hypothetical protein
MGAHRRLACRVAAALGVLVVASLGLAACGGGGADAPLPPVPARTASTDPFDDAVLHYVDLTVAEADLPTLVPFTGDYVPCDVRYDETDVARVGLRIKGESTARPVGDKPSWTLKTNEFVPGQRLHGKKKLHLHNCVFDASFLHEPVAYGLWRRAGAPAARARVTLNGHLGGSVEPYDDGFSTRTSPTATVTCTKASSASTHGAGGASSTRTKRLRRPRGARRLVEPDAARGGLDRTLAVSHPLLAVEALFHRTGTRGRTCCRSDRAQSPHNWYAYGDQSDGGRVTFSPQRRHAFSTSTPPGPPPPAPAAVRVLAHPSLRARFIDRVREILDTAWDTDALLAEIDVAERRILASVHEGDANADFELSTVADELGRLRRFIRLRPEIVRPTLR